MRAKTKVLINICIRILASISVFAGILDIFLKLIEVLENTLEIEYPYWDHMPTAYQIAATSGLFFGILWYVIEKRKNQLLDWLAYSAEVFIRIWLSFMIAGYGFAKVLKTQFQVPEFIRDEPMSEQHPFWLTWNYFGFSWEYSLILAAIEVGGAALILFRKTRLLGACVLFPAMANILLINKYYHISPEAYTATIFFNLGVIYLLLLDFDKIKDTFFAFHQVAPGKNFGFPLMKNLGRMGVLIAAYGLIWMYANDSTPNNTFLKGVWTVDSIRLGDEPAFNPNQRDSVLTKFYFEHQYESSVILEYNHHRNRSFNSFVLNKGQDSLYLTIGDAQMRLKVQHIQNKVLTLTGTYKNDTITMKLNKTRTIIR